jgi:hypothetical protein
MSLLPTIEKRGYVVGLTIFVDAKGGLGLFENGLRQNVLFLYRMFEASPNCRKVYLLNHGDADPKEIPAGLGLPAHAIFRTQEVFDQLDVVICVGAGMDRPTVQALKERGCRFICYKAGNGAVISLEAIVARPVRGDAERYFDVDYFDAVWMTPQHIHTQRGWVKTLYRCPVFEVPHIWSPLFVDQRPPEIQDRFGYRPGQRRWRVGVMDPNITVMKTSHLPMLACEAAYRNDPAGFEAFYITNGLPHAEDPHFRSFALSLSSVKAGLMTFEPRFVSVDFLANHCDAVVTHQWENGLNYLYYEVLFGGYPLIHNSGFLRDYGYYYPDFDAGAGGRSLLLALRNHDRRLEQYREDVAGLITRIDPRARHNIALHEELLRACLAGGNGQACAAPAPDNCSH